MYKTYFLLFIEFFKTGLFTFGGGYASLPFLYSMCENYNWFSYDELLQLIAISSITPGPIGFNMATYAGFKTLNMQGAIIASFALVLPMIIITSKVFKLYNNYKENNYIKSVLYVLRPTSCALIIAVGIKMFYKLVLNNSFSLSNIDYKALITLIFLFILTFKLSKTPIIYMVIAGILGVVFIFLK